MDKSSASWRTCTMKRTCSPPCHLHSPTMSSRLIWKLQMSQAWCTIRLQESHNKISLKLITWQTKMDQMFVLFQGSHLLDFPKSGSVVGVVVVSDHVSKGKNSGSLNRKHRNLHSEIISLDLDLGFFVDSNYLYLMQIQDEWFQHVSTKHLNNEKWNQDTPPVDRKGPSRLEWNSSKAQVMQVMQEFSRGGVSKRWGKLDKHLQ